jgi:cell division protein FtsW (lipid II flippase)/cell division protein FtsI/penicillin-binding protein 2
MRPEPNGTNGTRREQVLLGLSIAFVLAGAATLALAQPQIAPGPLVALSALFVVAFGSAHLLLNRMLPQRDPYLLPIAALLTGWGLLLVARLAPGFLARQMAWVAVSVTALVAIVRLRGDLRWLRRFRYTWLFGGLALLAATLVLGVNPSGYGPRLWLGALGLYFQPSEVLKLLLVAYMSSYLAERRGLIVSTRWRIGRWSLPPMAYVGPLLAMFALAALLLAWQQDLGTATLFLLTFLAMLYTATGQWGYAAAGLVCLLLVGAAGYWLSPLVALRVDAWLNPWPEAADRAFQVVQSLLAFASGGLVGQGLGLGSPTFIPAVHTDFVFAAVAEEFGLAGTLAALLLYTGLMMRGFRVALRAERDFERLLAAGLTTALVVQAWVIAAGNARLIPITGVTLPFMSYGGSSLLASYIALALVLAVSGQRSPITSPRPVASPGPALAATLTRLTGVLVLGMLALAGECGFWAVARAEPLRARDDNPRRIQVEQRIVRGTIVDRHNVVLAVTHLSPEGVAVRHYPAPAAAPVVGYSSLRHGTGGIEASLDAVLRGEAGLGAWEVLVRELLHRTPEGQAVRLTLDARLQEAAQQSMAEVTGAAVLLDARTGEVLALTSSPTFDPERLEEQWESLRADARAPLLNRATQGLYQPGAALQTPVLAEALSRGLADMSAPISDPTRVLWVNGSALRCHPHALVPATLAEAYALACPGPAADLGLILGTPGLADMVARWRLTSPPALEIPTAAADWSPEAISTPLALQAEAIGQGMLTLSPVQAAQIAATIANDGVMPALRLVLAIQDRNGTWRATGSQELSAVPVLDPEDARALLRAWPRDEDGLQGHWGTAIAGTGQAPHAWFIGVARRGEGERLAVAVLIEHAAQPQDAAAIGTALLRLATR